MNKQERIDEHRLQIKKRYRGIYDKAISGKSRKSALHAFCLECCGWQIEEVFLCTSPQCPLYLYRPKSSVPQDAPESVSNKQESTNSKNKGNG